MIVMLLYRLQGLHTIILIYTCVRTIFSNLKIAYTKLFKIFSVRPPKKTWKVISNLSGGEKTLSSLALVFALHYYKPSPLYVMDEIDAALDFKNVSIIAYYIKVIKIYNIMYI